MSAQQDQYEILGRETTGQLILTVKVSRDHMNLLVDCDFDSTKEKSKIDQSMLLFLLRGKIDRERINVSALDAMLPMINAGKPLRDRKIAQGKPPVPGEDGRLFQIVKIVEPPARAGDIRYIADIQRVVPGTILGIVMPPQTGAEGEDVFGKPVQAVLGKPFKVHFDKSILLKPSLQEGGNEYLVAHASGYLTKDKDKLKIQSILEVAGDVDPTLGKVEFIGKMNIEKDVAKGVALSTWEDIHIHGRTHGGALDTLKGSIKVEGMVLGGPGCMVSAGGAFNALMTQNLRLSVLENAAISKEARDSEIDTFGMLEMKRGHLLGGRAFSLGGMEIGVVGSDAASLTVVGCKSRAQVQAELVKLEESLTEYSVLESSISEKLTPLGLDKEKIPPLDGNQSKRINELLLKVAQIQATRDVWQRKKAKMQEALARPVWFQLNFQEMLYKGVVVRVGEDQLLIEADHRGPGTIEYTADGKFNDIPRQKKMFAAAKPSA